VNERLLQPVPITQDLFAPYGDVIEARAAASAAMNSSRFERFHDLAQVDVSDEGGRVGLSIARCKTAATFPHRIEMVERHPHGTQAFIPLSPFVFVVAVAPAAERFDPQSLRAFVTDGTQGVNYRKGVWHMPLIALQAGQSFLIVDRRPTGDNCDECALAEPLQLVAPG
jgi:ureidoglycolate lyase